MKNNTRYSRSRGRSNRRRIRRKKGKILTVLIIGLLVLSGFVFGRYFFDIDRNHIDNTNARTDEKDLTEDTTAPSKKPQTSDVDTAHGSKNKQDEEQGDKKGKGQGDGQTDWRNSGQNEGQGDSEDNGQVADKIREHVNKMTLQEKIGQMVIVGFEGYTIDENVTKMIDTYKVGGFILFGRNVENSEQLLALNNSLKAANSKNQIPLFISVDEEGGIVSRMPDEFRKLPSNKAIGDMNNEDLSFEIGNILAEELRLFG
ncbi:MAG: glycoside hydrolase family 3 protein, partial [Clostridiaceae bacterium]|nr:glycoside hydrolase family 3 protein [Clostridiaceae bacterium]